MDWIVLVKDKEQMRVRPRGVDALLSQGWTVLGANQEPSASKEPEVTPPKRTTRKKNESL